MKRIIALLLALAMMLVLCACGKSEAVKQTEEAIANIGEVDLLSGERIMKAEDLYASLSEKEASAVKNYAELVTAREKYNALVYETAIGNMEAYDYEKALSLLESIPAYKDAKEKIKEAEDGVFQSMCASYVFNFIKDGSFYNPSAVRVLNAAYGGKDSKNAKLLGIDGILFLKVQGTNKLGGTLNKEFAILIGGKDDGKAYSNDDSGLDYKTTDKVVDVPTINKMLQKYWEEYGL